MVVFAKNKHDIRFSSKTLGEYSRELIKRVPGLYYKLKNIYLVIPIRAFLFKLVPLAYNTCHVIYFTQYIRLSLISEFFS